MKDALSRFSDRVEDYVKFRPGYPVEILQILIDHIDLSQSDVIADIGSGTGIMSKLFLDNGNKVFAVEPNFAMRQASEAEYKVYPNFVSSKGTAEATKIPSDSVNLAIAAQAFHWFDPQKFRIELKRVCVRNANLVLIWNERLRDIDEFHSGYEELILNHSIDYKQIDHSKTGFEKLTVLSDLDNYKYFELDNKQSFNFVGLKGRLMSSSYVPKGEKAKPMIAELKILFDKHKIDGLIDLKYKTQIYIISLKEILL